MSTSPIAPPDASQNRLDPATKRIGILKDIGLALESTMSFDDVLTMAAESTTSVMGAHRTTLFLVKENGELISRVLEGDNHPGENKREEIRKITEIRLDPGKGLAGWTARHGRPLLIEDAYADERFDSSWDTKTGFTTHSVMCHPILGRSGQVIGVAEVLNKKIGEFDSADLELLGVVCSQLSMTIENSKMMLDLVHKNRIITDAKQKLEKRNRELSVLLEIERIVARAEDLDSLGPRIFARILEILDAQLGCLYMVNADGAQSRICSADKKINTLLRVEVGSGFTGWTAAKGKELCIPEPAGDPRFEESIQKRVGVDLANLAVVPLPFSEKSHTQGALLVANKNKNSGFDASDMILLRLVGAQLALAVEHLMNRDIRERERRLATVGRLLAGVLHDLKTPVTVISGYAELLALSAGTPEGEEYLNHVKKALNRITNMATEIVSFSKGKQQLLIRRCSLNDFLDGFIGQIENYLQSNKIELLVRKRTSGTIKIDQEKMLRAFHNIVLNAVEAMPDGGQIILEVDKIGNEIIFSFTDSGSGIPEEIQGSVFQSFVTLGKDHGTGLGLTLVREIVEGHMGTVNFITSRGGGTTFLINIPD